MRARQDSASLQRLTYSVVIATCDRHDILPACVEHVLQQSRPPREIVIVDATLSWQSMKTQVEAKVGAHGRAIALHYEGAAVRSLTAQRNQGLALATGDVVFFIDDDSLMYPDCAKAIMAIYGTDAGRAIVGCQAALADAPPASDFELPMQKITGAKDLAMRGRFMQWVNRYVFMMAADQMFLPYWGRRATTSNPALATSASTVPLLHGCRMTFRRAELGHAPFDADLGSYAAAEDADASYRASRHGALVEVRGARIYHHTAASGRLRRGHAAELSAMNVAFLLRKNAGPGLGALLRLYVWLARRVLAEFLKDLFSGRLGFPQWKAMLRCTASAWELWFSRSRDLRQRYVDMQVEIAQRHGDLRDWRRPT